MIAWCIYKKFSLQEKINFLYQHGTYVMSIRYYTHKVNLYLLGDYYVEVFIDHKDTLITKISPLSLRSKRIQFYSDQIILPADLLQ
jgi:hypothetical protein